MKCVVLFPTIEEAKSFIITEQKHPVFISGVGMAETAASLIKAIKVKRPQFVVLAGIAGAYDRSLKIGDVVEVTQERISQLPERYIETYKNDGVTDLLGVSSNSVVTSSSDSNGAQIENMEGAALFSVCKALDVECCQVRAISNYVGDPFEEWDIDGAVANLTKTLAELFEAMED